MKKEVAEGRLEETREMCTSLGGDQKEELFRGLGTVLGLVMRLCCGSIWQDFVIFSPVHPGIGMLDITEGNRLTKGQGAKDNGNIGKKLMEEMNHRSWLGGGRE